MRVYAGVVTVVVVVVPLAFVVVTFLLEAGTSTFTKAWMDCRPYHSAAEEALHWPTNMPQLLKDSGRSWAPRAPAPLSPTTIGTLGPNNVTTKPSNRAT